jgi:hypothetical protein
LIADWSAGTAAALDRHLLFGQYPALGWERQIGRVMATAATA